MNKYIFLLIILLFSNLIVADSFRVSVSKIGNGDGEVESAPFGIDCGWYCSKLFPAGTELILTAEPNVRSSFIEWGGDCSGTEPTCNIIVDSDKEIIAEFGGTELRVNKIGSGNGEIKSAPFGIDCGLHCNRFFPLNTNVILVANPNVHSTFIRWEGGCSGTEPICNIIMNTNKEVTAVFESANLQVNIEQTNGSGRVTSLPFGIDCEPHCNRNYPLETEMILTAIPDPTSSFTRWEGDCTGTEPKCMLDLNSNKEVTAIFGRENISKISINKQGNGDGKVTSLPFGIDCGLHCEKDFQTNTEITLIADSNIHSTFIRWEGDCTGTEPECILNLDSDKNVIAIFESKKISVSKIGSGRVTSLPFGIDCGLHCNKFFPFNSQVKLTATPTVHSTFIRWEGDCTGTESECILNLDSDKNVIAIFESFRLSINKIGEGDGRILSYPFGIDCGLHCNKNFAAYSRIILIATPQVHSEFIGWNGACSGTEYSCVLNLNEDKEVTAIFERNTEVNRIEQLINLINERIRIRLELI